MRWPLHPQPGQLESLSSWVDRLAVTYGMTTKHLLGPNNLELGGEDVPYNLDFDPPPVILTELAKRTGVAVDKLKGMTIAGMAPLLFDSATYLNPRQAQQSLLHYIRDNSLLLAPGDAGMNVIGDTGRWLGPWHPGRHFARRCPQCANDPDKGLYLVWQLPLTLGCGEHRCYLEPSQDVAIHMLTQGKPLPARPIPEPLTTLEAYTHSALTTGLVELPGRTVQAIVWFRLLRSLLDEVSLALSSRSVKGRAALQQVWAATGLPERGGLKMWKAYEDLDFAQQEAMMLAAATALDLAAKGEITGEGRLASAIQPPREQYVYDGDQPAPRRDAWQEAVAEAEAVMIAARTDRETAKQLLIWFTYSCRSLTGFEQQRSYLFGAGIPAPYLPTAAELGRFDLI